MPTMTMMPVMTAPTVLTQVMSQQQVNDEFDDIINNGFFGDDDGGDGDESCQFHIGECDETAKFWLSLTDQDTGESVKYFFCPRHFALRLHLIIDAVRRNVFFDEQTTPAQVRSVVHSYFSGWGRCRG